MLCYEERILLWLLNRYDMFPVKEYQAELNLIETELAYVGS